MPKTRIQGIAEVLPGGTRGRLEFDFVDAQPVPGVVLETVPTPDQVRTKVDIHASRMPIGDNDIRVALHNIQNNLGLETGRKGGWTAEAWESLRQILRKPKQTRGLARLAQSGMLALPAPVNGMIVGPSPAPSLLPLPPPAGAMIAGPVAENPVADTALAVHPVAALAPIPNPPSEDASMAANSGGDPDSDSSDSSETPPPLSDDESSDGSKSPAEHERCLKWITKAAIEK